jgi:hypothetical protein
VGRHAVLAPFALVLALEPEEILREGGLTNFEGVTQIVTLCVRRALHDPHLTGIPVPKMRRACSVDAQYVVDVDDLIGGNRTRSCFEATPNVVNPGWVGPCNDAVLGVEVLDVDDVAFLEV